MVKQEEKNTETRNNNGITLIALIVTIIVLLILAGVSIAMLTRRKWNIIKCNLCKICNRSKRNTRTSQIKGNARRK